MRGPGESGAAGDELNEKQSDLPLADLEAEAQVELKKWKSRQDRPAEPESPEPAEDRESAPPPPRREDEDKPRSQFSARNWLKLK
jgi:hypothetical protein